MSKHFNVKRKQVSNKEYAPYTPLDFSLIDKQAKKFADIIETHFEGLAHILLKYESYEVVQDEIGRTLDLLRNLGENKKYFRLRVGAVTSFLPRNQPLYAFTCFVVVPSLMASEVHFRIPQSMRGFFPEMLKFLDISKLFPNIFVSHKQRIEFLTDRSAFLVNPKSQESRPASDAVIFTGIPLHADQLRFIFDRRTLFIANGAGHNPVVVSDDADIEKATEAVVTLQFYNQGQDCAAPNAILVHKDILAAFLSRLRERISSIKVGHYHDQTCSIGPISDPEDLLRIQEFLVENRQWLDPFTPGVIRTKDAIVEPIIVCKPLVQGGNFSEIFAPIIFVQEYENDAKLKNYFRDQRYAQNAMYVTLYGTSKYVKNLIGRPIRGKVLHRRSSLLHNTHLHMPGVERGTEPYGGYGYGASSLSIRGKITPKPTLPQRDIYEYITKPIILKKLTEVYRTGFQRLTEIYKKDVQKLLKLQSFKMDKQTPISEPVGTIEYLDVNSIKTDGLHYVKVGENNIYHLLKGPNMEYILTLKPEDIKLIHELKTLLRRKSKLSSEEFRTLLYAIPKKPKATDAENKILQNLFFQHIYQLLFNQKSGPRLASFLFEVEGESINGLLGV